MEHSYLPLAVPLLRAEGCVADGVHRQSSHMRTDRLSYPHDIIQYSKLTYAAPLWIKPILLLLQLAASANPQGPWSLGSGQLGIFAACTRWAAMRVADAPALTRQAELASPFSCTGPWPMGLQQKKGRAHGYKAKIIIHNHNST